jgi:hypothetical protein
MRHWVRRAGFCGFLALFCTMLGAAIPARAWDSSLVMPGAGPQTPSSDLFGMLRRSREARLTERGSSYYSGGPVSVHVSLGSQTMTVSVGGEVVYRWAISSGRIGYSTPHGTYRPQRLAVMWRSHRFHMSPMPYSIFFRGGYAIHGTYSTAYLGSRASHGCIRLSPGHAATLFALVRSAGYGRTRITITG